MTARSPEPERVAERAYSIWEEEGRPHGRDHAHWQRAESELAGQPVTVPGAKAAAPAAEPAAKQPARGRKPAAASPPTAGGGGRGSTQGRSRVPAGPRPPLRAPTPAARSAAGRRARPPPDALRVRWNRWPRWRVAAENRQNGGKTRC